MKKTIMLILCILILIVGCDEQKENKENCVTTSSLDEIYTVACDGHKYVIYNGINKGGIVHAESCECKKNNQ